MSQLLPLHFASRTLRSPTSIVHLEYNPETLASVPSHEWTRFVCISDTHARTFHVPAGDVLLHSGDLTNTGTFEEFCTTMDWLYGLPHKVKIIIAGNHDLTLDTDWYDQNYMGWHRNGKEQLSPIMDLLKGNRAKAAGITYLQDERYTFRTKEGGRTWSIYGSPWSPYFFGWAFNYKREDGEKLVSKFPKTDILLTHGPVSGVFDCTNGGDLAGCEALRTRIAELRPRIHLAGHIHEGHGACIHAWIPDQSGALVAPIVQNNNNDPEFHFDSNVVDDPPSLDAAELQPDIDRTVFVNAANWPSGRRAVKAPVTIKRKLQFGGPGFQAVVVDLKD